VSKNNHVVESDTGTNGLKLNII